MKVNDWMRASRFQCSLALSAVQNLSPWLVRRKVTQLVLGGAMNAILFAQVMLRLPESASSMGQIRRVVRGGEFDSSCRGAVFAVKCGA